MLAKKIKKQMDNNSKDLKDLEPHELVKKYVEAKTGNKDLYFVIPDDAITEAVAGIEQILDFLDIDYITE